MSPDDKPMPPTTIEQISTRSRTEDPPLLYDSHVFVCTNQRPAGHPRGCCKDKGSEGLRDYMKARAKELGVKNTRINSAGCLERCELGPSMVIYPEGVWYAPKTREDIDEILQTHMIEGRRVTRLMLKPGDDPPKATKKPKPVS
jgi:(2Fe-2S) ferredoxin